MRLPYPQTGVVADNYLAHPFFTTSYNLRMDMSFSSRNVGLFSLISTLLLLQLLEN